MDTKTSLIGPILGCLSLALIAGCASPLPQSPTPEPNVLLQVTLDGAKCTFSGPSEVTTGRIDVAFDIRGDLSFRPWVDRFVDGKGLQDFEAIYLGPEKAHVEPSWVEHPPYITRDHKVWTFTLDEPGPHAILVGSYAPWREYICGPLQVVAATSG
jgi:hypothetical protein